MIGDEKNPNDSALQVSNFVRVATIEAFPFILAACILLVSGHAVRDIISKVVKLFSG